MDKSQHDIDMWYKKNRIDRHLDKKSRPGYGHRSF